MIITKTPYRISFFGGGTDYPDWYRQHGGSVLATAIDRYCYISCRYLPPFFEHKHRIVYSRIEAVRDFDQIIHPAVREGLRFMEITTGVEIHHDGDLPKNSGLGTSSSFTVGLLHALHALRGEMAAPMQLASEAIHVEREMCGDRVGSQDQVTAAFGGLNCVSFASDDTIRVQPVTMPPKDRSHFLRHLMLFFTGVSRISSTIAEEQLTNMPRNEMQLREMGDMVQEGISLLTQKKDYAAFGRLLHESWQIKQLLSSKITNPDINSMYESARRAGAIGGKLCGAGGGGFFIFVVPPERHEAVKKAIHPCLHVPFGFDAIGSQLVFYQPTTAEEDKR